MSWWVYLEDRSDPQFARVVQVPPHAEGGTYVMGGTPDAALNITYNYNRFYRQVFGVGLREALHGKKASETIPILDGAVKILGATPEPDHYQATEGNAGFALALLLSWAHLAPQATFRVSG